MMRGVAARCGLAASFYLAARLGAALALALGVVACGRPSRADCERAIDHFVEVTLAGRDAAEDRSALLERRGELVEECRRQSTRDDIDCISRARTRMELERCR